jgi:hypothetical protein
MEVGQGPIRGCSAIGKKKVWWISGSQACPVYGPLKRRAFFKFRVTVCLVLYNTVQITAPKYNFY